MASSRVVSRLSTRIPSVSLKQLPNFNQPKLASLTPLNRISGFSRLPVELSCGLLSMLPLHSTIASARLISSLPIISQKWGLIPQGISMPL